MASLYGCTAENSSPVNPITDSTPPSGSADVTAVSVGGVPGSYTFSVTVESPDTGCGQYADWWEVLTADGSLVYRRILTHSHVVEQPFTRSGGPIAIAIDDSIIVRAHMNNVGYGDVAFTGSVEQGLIQQSIDASFAEELEIADPLPSGCGF